MKFSISIMAEEKYEIREIVVEKPELKHLTYLRKDDIEELAKIVLIKKGYIRPVDKVDVTSEEWLGEKEIYFSYPFQVFRKVFEGKVYGKALSPKGEDIKEMIILLKLPKEKETLEKVS
jgi:plastocyanin domain-containing protein